MNNRRLRSLFLFAFLPVFSAVAQLTTNFSPRPSTGFNLPAPSAAPATTSSRGAPGVIATYGKIAITVDELQPYLETLAPEQRALLQSQPKRLESFMRTFVVQRILWNKAQAEKWSDHPGVAAQLERLRQNAIADSFLENATRVPDNYPSDAELREAYEKGDPAFTVPRKFRVAQIFIAKPKAGEEKATQKKLAFVEACLKRSDADFARIASMNTEEAASAQKGGEVGWLPENQMFPEVRRQLSALPKGGVSGTIGLDDGWHILKILDVEESRKLSLDEVRPRLVEALRSQKARENSEAYIAGLLKAESVSINRDAIARLFPAPTP